MLIIAFSSIALLVFIVFSNIITSIAAVVIIVSFCKQVFAITVCTMSVW